MALISLVFCLFVERFLSSFFIFRQYNWFLSYAEFVSRIKNFPILQTHAGIALLLIPIPLLTGLVDIILQQYLLSLEFLFSTVVLLYCFGPVTFYDKVRALHDALEKGDDDSAKWCENSIQNHTVDNHAGTGTANSHILPDLFSIANERLLAVIFWFVILGPMGALLFRLSSQLHGFFSLKLDLQNRVSDQFLSDLDLWHSILNWIPSRLTAMGYVFSGKLMRKSNFPIKSIVFTGNLRFKQTQILLQEIGSQAAALPTPCPPGDSALINASLLIIRRNIELWLASIAIVTLIGWI